MKRRFWAVSLLFLLVLVFLPVTNAAAQEPTDTPAPTATPENRQVITVTSGNAVYIERTITYGDIAVVITVGVLLVVTILSNAVKIAKGFVPR